MVQWQCGAHGTSDRPQLLYVGYRLVKEETSGLHLPPPQKSHKGRRESLTGCSHPTTTSQSAEISSTMLLHSFCNLKDLVRIYSEPQHGWIPPRGQCYQEERDIQRCWFHNSVQMFPDARIVTQQTSGPHVLPPIHSSTRHPRSPCCQEQNT